MNGALDRPNGKTVNLEISGYTRIKFPQKRQKCVMLWKGKCIEAGVDTNDIW